MWSAGIFDPLGFAKGSNLASLKTKEIKNGVPLISMSPSALALCAFCDCITNHSLCDIADRACNAPTLCGSLAKYYISRVCVLICLRPAHTALWKCSSRCLMLAPSMQAALPCSALQASWCALLPMSFLVHAYPNAYL